MSAFAPWGRPDSPFQTLVPLRVAAAIGVLGAIGTVVLADLPRVGLVLGCVSVGLLFVVYPLFSLA